MAAVAVPVPTIVLSVTRRLAVLANWQWVVQEVLVAKLVALVSPPYSALFCRHLSLVLDP